MADVTTLRADLEKLRAAYRSGAHSVGYGDKRVEYRDAAGMREAIAALEAEIARAEGTKPRLIVARSSKGW